MWSRANHSTMRTLSFLFCKLIKFGLEEFCSPSPFWNICCIDRKSKRGCWASYQADNPGSSQDSPRWTRGYYLKTGWQRMIPAALRTCFQGGWASTWDTHIALSLCLSTAEQHFLISWWSWKNEQQQLLRSDSCINIVVIQSREF